MKTIPHKLLVRTRQQYDHVKAAAFDRDRSLLYVFEPLADGDQPLVHVWKVLAAGGAPTPTPVTPAPSPPPARPVLQSGDYDGDGTDEIAIFRESAGLWAVRGISRAYFGGYGDLPVSGDYDGDGTTDIGVFRCTTGLWAVKGVTR